MAPSPRTPGLPVSLSQPISHGMAYLRTRLGSFAWHHGVAIARPAILSLFTSIEIGTLELVDEPSKEHHVFGQALALSPANQPHATLTIISSTFYLRLLLLADMGFAASYLLHEVRCPDLTAFFRLFVLNRARLNNGSTWSFSLLTGILSNLSSVLLRLGMGGPTNTVSNAHLNAAAHYDLGNDMFAGFLSVDMTYSCPIWATTAHGGLKSGDGQQLRKEEEEEELEAAQMRKLRRIIDAARIKATDHVLEIGAGWGSFAIEAVRRTGCRVTTVTLSQEQKTWAEEKVRKEGLEKSVKVLLVDYRAVPEVEGGYDKIVSIEMLEAVGRGFLGTYFARVERLLKRNGGVAVFQCITMPEGRQRAYERTADFINRYIFPGGYLPSITQLLNHITTESNGTLIVENVENIGGHYARALRRWKERFLVNFDDKIYPALTKEHPEMQEEDIEVFRRKWEYYFAYCEAGFMTKTLGDVIITVGREGAMELMEGIPL